MTTFDYKIIVILNNILLKKNYNYSYENEFGMLNYEL